jgi:hypothetical protein
MSLAPCLCGEPQPGGSPGCEGGSKENPGSHTSPNAHEEARVLSWASFYIVIFTTLFPPNVLEPEFFTLPIVHWR